MQYCKSKYPELMLSVYEKNEREGFKVAKEEMDKTTNEKEYVMVWKNKLYSW